MKTVATRSCRVFVIFLVVLSVAAPLGLVAAPTSPPVFLRFARASDAEDEGAWLGIWLGSVSRTVRRKYHLHAKDGVFVVNVVDDSPADRAGIRRHDVILSFDGERVRTPDDLSELLDEYQPGDTVKIEIEHRGRRKTVQVVLGRRPESPFRVPVGSLPARVLGWSGASRLGVELQELNPDLARYFKLREPRGALITSVDPDSPAEQAGLKAGDVIVEIDGENIEAPEDVDDVLEDVEPGDTVSVTVIREGHRKSFNVVFRGRRWQGRFYVTPQGIPRSLRKQLERLQRYNLELQQRWQEEGVQEKLERGMKELQKQMREMRKQFERMQRELEELKRSK